jgi:hypothetical protein
MTTSRKWLCFGALIVAGLLSLLLSFWGVFGLAWVGFPQTGVYDSAWELALFLPFVLAFPLLALAVGATKYATLALWIIAPLPSLTVLVGNVNGFKGGPSDLMKFLAECIFASVPLLILAALVHFGTHFYEFTRDSRWVRWKEPKHALTT